MLRRIVELKRRGEAPIRQEIQAISMVHGDRAFIWWTNRHHGPDEIDVGTLEYIRIDFVADGTPPPDAESEDAEVQ